MARHGHARKIRGPSGGRSAHCHWARWGVCLCLRHLGAPSVVTGLKAPTRLSRPLPYAQSSPHHPRPRRAPRRPGGRGPRPPDSQLWQPRVASRPRCLTSCVQTAAPCDQNGRAAGHRAGNDRHHPSAVTAVDATQAASQLPRHRGRYVWRPQLPTPHATAHGPRPPTHPSTRGAWPRRGTHPTYPTAAACRGGGQRGTRWSPSSRRAHPTRLAPLHHRCPVTRAAAPPTGAHCRRATPTARHPSSDGGRGRRTGRPHSSRRSPSAPPPSASYPSVSHKSSAPPAGDSAGPPPLVSPPPPRRRRRRALQRACR
ncbi:hypothetical protein BU14_0025s0054 [Porphyra umbilicalis]|uniref:Uncharacterized protein n=1 Tax=Porphyra umbilicalis TaxID=2786 RepID=A0A1X6PKI0_PORUM|nr:hypothetical protein BU14_0025s0054 [Porphyra umbilicalis]|eukprot:OSX81173.1 hypothetical protein BU14_0025s0054 [Porphyra umbilicalis]